MSTLAAMQVPKLQRERDGAWRGAVTSDEVKRDLSAGTT